MKAREGLYREPERDRERSLRAERDLDRRSRDAERDRLPLSLRADRLRERLKKTIFYLIFKYWKRIIFLYKISLENVRIFL